MTLTLAEMYVQGVSTRKVSAIVEQLCGVSISSTLVSEAADLADLCLAQPGVQSVTVRVEKPGILPFARSVGVEITRGLPG